MVVYYRITNSHADYYDVSVIPIAAFRRHVLWWVDYRLQDNLSQTSCLNMALRTTFSMNKHMQVLNILLIIIFILGVIIDTYATHKTKKYSWHFMSFLCFLLVFIISIVFYSKEDFVFYLGTSASIVCAITSGYKLFAWASSQTQRNKLCISRLIKNFFTEFALQAIAHDEKKYYICCMDLMDSGKYMPYASTRYIHCNCLFNISGSYGRLYWFQWKQKIIDNIILYIDSISLFHVPCLPQARPEFYGYFYIMHLKFCGNCSADPEKKNQFIVTNMWRDIHAISPASCGIKSRRKISLFFEASL